MVTEMTILLIESQQKYNIIILANNIVLMTIKETTIRLEHGYTPGTWHIYPDPYLRYTQTHKMGMGNSKGIYPYCWVGDRDPYPLEGYRCTVRTHANWSG
jgi:hypothetical protein